ncbi:MAG: urease accessory protein UreE [Nitrospirae bacterium]|nr:urease accessory protein UreE [Nitrospirota bacterium]
MIKEKVVCSKEELRALQRDSVVLDWHDRRKSRQKVKTRMGRVLCIALPRGTVLYDGDLLYKDEKMYIAVEAKSELQIVVVPANMEEAATVAYELGNRHLPLCILKDRIKTPLNKHVEELLKRYSIGYEIVEEPFEPFNSGAHHGHSHC